MRRVAIVTGRSRNDAVLMTILHDLHTLRLDDRLDEVVVSTWLDDELSPWVAAALREVRAEVVRVNPPAIDTYRNYRHQQVSLDAALASLNPDDFVMRVRTDWVTNREILARYLVPPSPCTSPVEALNEVFRERVRIPWMSTRVPFHLADETFSGRVVDIRRVNPAASALVLADPHAGRYLPHLLTHVPRLRGVLPLLDVLTQLTPDSNTRVIEMGGRCDTHRVPLLLEEAVRLRHTVTARALELPLYQEALAAYFVSFPWFFDIVSGNRFIEQYIDRHGPWVYSTPDVTDEGDFTASPDPVCYRVVDAAQLVHQVPQSYERLHSSFARFIRDPELLLVAPNNDELEAERAALLAAANHARIPSVRGGA